MTCNVKWAEHCWIKIKGFQEVKEDHVASSFVCLCVEFFITLIQEQPGPSTYQITKFF